MFSAPGAQNADCSEDSYSLYRLIRVFLFCFVLGFFLKTMTSEGAKRQKLYIQAEKATLLLLAQTEKSFSNISKRACWS